MSKIKKFTFKNQPAERGLAAVGHGTPDADIKHNGKIVGWISPTSYHQKECRALFFVKNEPTHDDPCDFRVVRLVHTTQKVSEMKEWLKENTESLVSKLDLFYKD